MSEQPPGMFSTPLLTQSLVSTARDGVDARVIVPATNDIAWFGAVSRSGYRQFLQAGVRIFFGDFVASTLHVRS